MKIYKCPTDENVCTLVITGEEVREIKNCIGREPKLQKYEILERLYYTLDDIEMEGDELEL